MLRTTARKRLSNFLTQFSNILDTRNWFNLQKDYVMNKKTAFKLLKGVVATNEEYSCYQGQLGSDEPVEHDNAISGIMFASCEIDDVAMLELAHYCGGDLHEVRHYDDDDEWNGETPATEAAFYRSRKCLKFLAEQGVDLCVHPLGFSARAKAAFYNYVDIVDFIDDLVRNKDKSN